MSTNTREYITEYMRQYRAAGRENRKPRHVAARNPFVGWDGEGVTLDNGYHAYNMLRIGTEIISARYPHVRLTTMDCLTFMSNQDPKNIYVGYFTDYDVTKILEDLPWTKLDRLVHREKRTGLNGQLYPVDWEGFQLDYLPKKEFKVRRMLSQSEDKTVWSPWIVYSDVGTFFQMSFLRAIQVWDVGSEEQHAQISEGKAKRAAFEVKDFEEVASYNALEIELLQQLMEKFRNACIQAGYVPRKWQGPGVLAETMLQAHGVSKTKDVALLNSAEYQSLVTFARNAYYGGRFEVACIGSINVPTYQKDINSAYPHAMQFVPCLEHGGWEYFNKEQLAAWPNQQRAKGLGYSIPKGRYGESYALMFGSFQRKGTPTLWYGLPVRTAKGTIVFPESGRGWYWSFEVGSAVHQDFTPEEMWVYTRRCDCKPLGFVSHTYQARQKLGKDGPGLILKLGMNSLYGKTVQSIGFPKYANPIWGSFITAFPRMMINDLIHSSPLCRRAWKQGVAGCGRDIVMVATDSVATTIDRSADIEISGELGAWSCEVHQNGMFIVQPGVYFGSSGKPTKTRGFTRTVVDHYEPDFRSAYARMVASGDLNHGVVTLPITVFCGIRYALQRHDMSLLGQWIEYGADGVSGKALSFDWTSKRMPMTINPTKDRPWIQTLPYAGATDFETVPYSKNIGGLLDAADDRLAFADLPDWSPLGDIYE